VKSVVFFSELIKFGLGLYEARATLFFASSKVLPVVVYVLCAFTTNIMITELITIHLA